MGYQVVDPAALEATPDRPCDRRALSDAAGLERVALNRYEAAPGEQLPLAYHYHDEHEEAFFVLAGDLHVETPEETYVVREGRLFVAEPESPHRAYNPSDATAPVRVLAVGAPRVDDVHASGPDR